MYGLRKYKQKASSNEKRIKKKFSQEKSKNKKNKIHNPSTSQYKRKKNIESPVLVREDLERKNFLRKHNISLKKKKSELRLSKSKLCIRKWFYICYYIIILCMNFMKLIPYSLSPKSSHVNLSSLSKLIFSRRSPISNQ